MPHINRIRVNNVKYNFGTQYYDNFVMRFSGKSTIYDLANGGGKSVLMLLLLQNMIPNCTLDEKQPVEKLFRSGNTSQAIHSLVEWKLNPNDIEDGCQYMTTGFCARKAKEGSAEADGEKTTEAIEYFNYVLFYREFNEHDIVNLPLSHDGERVTYLGLKSYLRELEKKNSGVKVKVFNRKGDYQHFISRYGIYESQWEIIRGINKTEGHVRTYFETNYRTTQKVVEDLLIEEIIQKSFYHEIGVDMGENTGDNARTLLDIKDKLIELTKKKKEISGFDRQKELLEAFIRRMYALKGEYSEKSGLEEQFLRAYHSCKKEQEKAKEKEKYLAAEKEKLLAGQKLYLSQIETAKIQMEEEKLTELKAEGKRIKTALMNTEEKLIEERSNLRLRESANDYLSFLENKKQYQKYIKAIDEMQNKSGGQLKELEALCYYRKQYLDEEKKLLKEVRTDLETELELLSKEAAAAAEEIKKTEQTLAVKRHQLAQTERAESEQQAEQKLLREQTGLLLLSDGRKELAENQREQEQLQKEQEQQKKSLEEYQQKIQEQTIQLSLLSSRREEMNSKLEETGKSLMSFHEKKEHLNKLKEVYQEKESKRLFSVIHQAFQVNSEELFRLRTEQEKLEKRMHSLAAGFDEEEQEQLERLSEALNKELGMECETGLCYFKNRPSEERAELLKLWPLLPFSIIVKEKPDTDRLDSFLKEKEFGGFPVPLIWEGTLEGGKPAFSKEEIYFAAGRYVFCLDERTAGKEQALFAERLQQQKQKIEALEENQKTVQKDLMTVREFYEVYNVKYQEDSKQYEASKGKERQLGEELERLEGETKECTHAVSKLSEEILQKEASLSGLKKTGQLLERLGKLEGQRAELSKEAGSLEEETGALEDGLLELSGKRELFLKKEQELQESLAANKRHTERLRTEWELTYSKYYREDTYPESSLGKEEIEAEFSAKKDAFEQKNADASDKKTLAESYRLAMEKNLGDIVYRGNSVDELHVLSISHNLNQTGLEKLNSMKMEIQNLEDTIRVMKNQAEGSAEEANQMFGKIAHAKAVFEQEFGKLKKLPISAKRLPMVLEDNQKRLGSLSQKLKHGEKQQRELQRLSIRLEHMQEDLYRMLQALELNPEEGSELLKEEVSLSDVYEQLKKRFTKMTEENYKRRESFEKEKRGLVKALKEADGHELSIEIERSLAYPEREQEVPGLISDLGHTVSCIELEKANILQSIEDIQRIKENFENQCLQTCIQIRSALERLPKLSKIQMEDRQIPVVTLQIPYIKEELYRAAMSDYIDEIVKNADVYEDAKERIKYIRNQLAWKKLFSVIVKDMSSIKLNLYKRERITEQSRYLKYEEAVGSTGQSQGIYIQFLIAVINYISSMNSSDADQMKLKKVIFIDNPFGAAKDIYIWEPIFRLMKANNVQLIVPARGATPAITGRFEVNYVLGQRFIGGKQQTVVVDYRSQTEEEETEYQSMEYEQTRLKLS